ncbi:MAG: preprotein translocase subunit SecA, partial [Oceanococcaceae bacterium]
MAQILSRIFGSRNQRVVAKLDDMVRKAGSLEEGLKALDDAALTAKTAEFKQRLEAGESLDALMPEAFAVVREAGRRVLGMRHFDVQLVGGAVLHQGRIAEMRTGEGKTLVATLPVYLNALTGKGVHVVTVNDYLARRDSAWMGQLYAFLGLSTGVVVHGQSSEEKRAAYACDITYGTNNEFGFDYLRDNMAFRTDDKVQRGHVYAVIDEVDSILIDEARTPLIISGPTDDNPDLYRRMNTLVPKLKKQEEEDGPGDFSIEEKNKQIFLTESGHQHVEELFIEAGLVSEGSLYDARNIILMHHLTAALRAHHLYSRDVEYIVRNGQIIIIDEFTGRMMPGRRWSDGLHQAVEAKEGVPIQQENQTLASITFQNFFRLYDKLSGMTGTADTEAFEFQQIYGLEVIVVPTNKPMIRDDQGDLVFMTAREKFEAIAEDVKDAVERGQPVLVGTASIETSEVVSRLLHEKGVKHEVLNAKQHAREAEIVAQAGSPGAVTIATNMAGRGTDIVLGGSLEAELAGIAEEDTTAREAARKSWEERHAKVLEAGGLYVLGSERHESRRIDNQLRGRSGRQGDPGRTRFYLSLEDNLMRIFTPPRLQAMLKGLGMEEGEAIEHKWVSRSIETAQRKVEAHNFDIRKNLLEYDNVANDQRRVIYEQRDELLSGDDVNDVVETIRADVITKMFRSYVPAGAPEELWRLDDLKEALTRELALPADPAQWAEDDKSLTDDAMLERIQTQVAEAYAAKREAVGGASLDHFEKAMMLQVLDTLWREHLASMDDLRRGIHLRGYAQKDPKQEFKREAFGMFQELLERYKQEVTTILCKVQIQRPEDVQRVEPAPVEREMHFEHADAQSALAADEAAAAQGAAAGASGSGAAPAAGAPVARARPARAPAPKPATQVRQMPKVGRNEPCPCGSGKKYKQCHG